MYAYYFREITIDSLLVCKTPFFWGGNSFFSVGKTTPEIAKKLKKDHRTMKNVMYMKKTNICKNVSKRVLIKNQKGNGYNVNK